MKINSEMDAQELVRQRNRQEFLVAAIAIAIPFLIMGMHKYWSLDVADTSLTAWVLLFFGVPITPSAIWVDKLRKKLKDRLGHLDKNDFLSEIEALHLLNNAEAWLLFQKKNRWSLVIIFSYFGALSLAGTTFIF